MTKDPDSNLPVWKFNTFQQERGINHFVTGRGPALGAVHGKEFNLGLKTSFPEEARQNRDALAAYFNIAPENLKFPDQTHSNNVTVITDAAQHHFPETDGLVTGLKGVGIAVLSADCVPILFYDSKKQVIGAVHAGWRGTTGKILTKAIELAKINFDIDPQDLKIAIGPSICQEVYEVGTEVVLAAKEAFGKKASDLFSYKEGKTFFDLWQANALQCAVLGIPPENIEIARICTYQKNEDFFSARKNGIGTGRFGAGLVMVD